MQTFHFLRRLSNSLQGTVTVWKLDPSFRARLVLSAAILLLALYVHLPPIELLLLIISICAMLSAELANTALEEVCDIIQPNFDTRIKKIKDILSATVFMAAIPVLIIATFCVLPLLWARLL